MWATRIIAVACFLAVCTEASITEIYEKAKLVISPAHIQDAFDGLNVAGGPEDKTVNMADMTILLYHKEAEFARQKFLTTVDGKDDGCEVDLKELTAYMQDPTVVHATYECTYVKSESLREQCFADQLLVLTYLQITVADAEAHFDYIESDDDKDEVIGAEEIKAQKEPAKFDDFDEEDVENLLVEMGGTDKKISKPEFVKYVMQEDISDDFRECREHGEVKTPAPVYKNFDCMTHELFDYTKNELTERDLWTLFDKLDNTDDLVIDKADATSLMKGITTAIDFNGDGKVCYGEFRTYAYLHTVQHQLEHQCTAVKDTQAEEIACLEELLVKLVAENHHHILMMIKDLEMLFTFETLDIDGDGIIDLKKDLEAKSWDPATAKKLIEFMDIKDPNGNVDLEEFFSYTDEPHVVYGIGDCLSKAKSEEGRIKCFIVELQDVIKDMLDKDAVEKLWKFYEQTGDGNKVIDAADLAKVGLAAGEETDNFLKELGMGDKTITHYEFTWYVRQQRLSDLFNAATEKTPEAQHKILLTWTKEVMTEYDTEMTFRALDTDKDMELEESDFKDKKEVFKKIQAMDGDDKDKNITFTEFWLWLNTPQGAARKRNLEPSCTKPKATQVEEIECYINNIDKAC